MILLRVTCRENWDKIYEYEERGSEHRQWNKHTGDPFQVCKCKG